MATSKSKKRDNNEGSTCFAGFTAVFLQISLNIRKNQSFLIGYVVEHTGFEPVTSTMRM